MRIADVDGNKLGNVYLALSDDEASELSDALDQLQSESAGWHAHVSDAEYKTEITVYREDDPTAAI